MIHKLILLSLCASVALAQTARHAFYYTDQMGSTCSSTIQNEVYNPNTPCATNGTCTERTFSAQVSAEEILQCPTGPSSNSYNPAVSLNYAKFLGYSNVDCSGLPSVIAVAPEDKCSGGSSVGTFQIRCDPDGFPSTVIVCGQTATDCETPQCAAVVPASTDGTVCTSTIGNGVGPVLGALSFKVQCPARYQMLTSWSDTTACEASKTPDAISFTRISHFPGVVQGCQANVNQICVSHDVEANNYPNDPNVDYAQFRSCRKELSDYTRPVDQGMIKFWCTPKDCHPVTKPDHVKVFQPGKCSGVTNDLFFPEAVNIPNGVRAWIIDCTTYEFKFYQNSQCLGNPTYTINVIADRQCHESTVPGGTFWGATFTESPCGQTPNVNTFGAQSYQLICPDTLTPTTSPTTSPTTTPTQAPSVNPTRAPSTSPTTSPTAAPSKTPTRAPSTSPTKAPSASPTTQFGSDLSFSHGTGRCDRAGSCRCRLAVIDCYCENSKFCFCENVAGTCYGGNAEIVTVGPEVNVQCENAQRCILETYAPTTAPPTFEQDAASSSMVLPSLLVLFMTVVMLY